MNTASQAEAFPLGFDETILANCGDHIAYLWESRADFARAVKFLEMGLTERDHCVLFGHEEANEQVLALLRSQDFAVEELIGQRRLIIQGGHETAQETLEAIGNTFGKLLEEGASRLRLLGNIGWGRPGWPSEADLIAFEANVTDAIAELPCVVVCMYDVCALPKHLIADPGFKAHPFTIFAAPLRATAIHR